jgi:hypothetical protein
MLIEEGVGEKSRSKLPLRGLTVRDSKNEIRKIGKDANADEIT